MRRGGLPTFPSFAKELGDDRKRIVKLEFRRPNLGDYLHWGENNDLDLLGLEIFTDAATGIQFRSLFGQWDTTGGGLSFRNDDIAATGVFSSVEILNTGIAITTNIGTTHAPITINAGDSSIFASAGVGGVIVNSGGDLFLDGVNARLRGLSGGDIDINALGGGSIGIAADNGSVNIDVTDGDVTISLNTAAHSVGVRDSGNNEIFRVDEDGSVHIKTGETIVADL